MLRCIIFSLLILSAIADDTVGFIQTQISPQTTPELVDKVVNAAVEKIRQGNNGQRWRQQWTGRNNGAGNNGQACSDNPNFEDEMKYGCSDWAGYDCSRAFEDDGYTEIGEENLIAECPATCGTCQAYCCGDKDCCKAKQIASKDECDNDCEAKPLCVAECRQCDTCEENGGCHNCHECHDSCHESGEADECHKGCDETQCQWCLCENECDECHQCHDAQVVCGDEVCNKVTTHGLDTEEACLAVQDAKSNKCCRWEPSEGLGCMGCGAEPCQAEACLCHNEWSDGACTNDDGSWSVQNGCPSVACDGDGPPWCLISNPGCSGEQHDHTGFGWAYCEAI